jgi:hypothetical protein
VANSKGAKAPKQIEGVGIEGVDLVPYLTGKNSGNPHETLF